MEQAQTRFWSGWFRVGTKPVLEQAQNRFWSGWLRVDTKPVLEQAQSRFWSRPNTGVRAVGLGRHKAGFGAGTKPVSVRQVRFCIKTGFSSSIEATKLDLSQNGSIQNLHQILRLKPVHGLLNPNPGSHSRFRDGTKPVLMQQVSHRRKAGFGATGLTKRKAYIYIDR